MLFSGGTSAKSKRDEKKEKKSDRDDKFEIQEHVYMKWGNSLILNEPLKEFKDLCDLRHIASVLEIVTGTNLTLTGSRTEDCATILSLLNDTKTSCQEFVEGLQKAILAVWWNLVQAFWKRFAPEAIRDEKVTEGIKQWCLEVTKDYEEVSVSDFTSSWRDGHAFNCLLHNFDRKLVHLRKISEWSASERIDNAFSVAEKEFKVPRFLTVKNLQSEHLDSRSVVCYLMTLYLTILGKSSIALNNEMMSTGPVFISAHDGQHHLSEQDHNAQLDLMHQQQYVQQPGASSSSEQQARFGSFAQTTSMDMPSTSHSIAQPENIIGQSEVKSARTKAQQSVDQPSESVEVRSRKSSSSSQKSGRSRRERKEAMTREFENCLEQVLTWLLEAEEELSLLPEIDLKEVGIVRTQFKEFELFMSSLTESQETVGRVLHRGQLLSNKAESDEERDAIQGQLHIVNQRWEELRALALDRQTKLQTQLNYLQQKQLSSISKWLSGMETEISSTGSIATETEAILEQMEEHSRIQTKIDDFQPIILQLNSFVAVVDDGESAEESVSSLEIAMATIGERWKAICNWAETRTNQLDGLAEIVAQTGQVYERLDQWLCEREQELMEIKSVHHLDDSEQVAEQVRKLQKAESAFEKEHGQFVRLSQLSCELVARLEAGSGNGQAANEARKRLDAVTQRWDNLVARIEEQSKMLVRSGKADIKQLKNVERSGDDSSTIEESIRADRVVVPDQATSTLQVTTIDTIPESLTETTDTDGEDTGTHLIDRFVHHVNKVNGEMEHLRHWTETFSASRKSDQIKKMINICQEKLMEIKDQEGKVSRLQLELEHLHLSPSLTSKQLKVANDAFDNFAKGWAKIVTKISESMNILTGHVDDSEEIAIAKTIEQWIELSNKQMNDLTLLPTFEQGSKLVKLEQQLDIHTSNLEFVEKDLVRRAILKKGLDIVRKKIETMKAAHQPTIAEDEEVIVQELDGQWSSVGDPTALDADIQRSMKLVQKARQENMSSDTVEKAETRRAEMEERKRATVAAFDKLSLAENTLNRIKKDVEVISKRDDDLAVIIEDLQNTRKELQNKEGEKKEAERATEKMLALDDNVAEEIISTNRARVLAVVTGWKELGESIDDQISCAKKEQRRTVQKALSNQERILEKLEKTLIASESATDAEECCEHLDNLENLLDKVKEEDQLESVIASMDESFVRESYARLSDTREKIAKRAESRVVELGKAVKECEHFEQKMSSFQSWAGVMQSLLHSRRAADVCALDVPEEYKPAFESGNLVQVLSKEFELWEKTLNELSSWLNDDEKKNNERMQAQRDHSKKMFTSLKEQFGEFKQPKSFSERLDRTLRNLSDVENALDDLTGIDVSTCPDALLEARRLFRQVKEIEDDLPALEKGKQDLIQNGLLDKETAQKVSEKLHHAKKKSTELGLRAEGSVDRLEDCVNLQEKLEEQSKSVDQFLSDIEQKMDDFSKQEKDLDEKSVEEIVSHFNRNENLLKILEDTERVLRENGVHVNENLTLEKRRFADMIKHRLDGLNKTVQEMVVDEDEQLLQLDQLHCNLMSKLSNVDNSDPSEIASTLRFLRGDRDRLSSRARQLAAANPRLASGELISGVNKKWQDLESRLVNPQNEDDSSAVYLDDIDAQQPFHSQVSALESSFKKANTILDFESKPVSSVTQWSNRIQSAEGFLKSARPILDRVLADGRRIANSGRMELQSHADIEKLDEICDIVDKMEMTIEDHRSVLDPILPEYDALLRDVTAMDEVIDQLVSRNLTDPEIAKATRKDLLDRDKQLSSLSARAASCHSNLPGKSSDGRDLTLVQLFDKVAKVEAALTALESSRVNTNATPIKTSPDRTSVSSLGPLAMEAHGNATDFYTTEDEQMLEEKGSEPSSAEQIIETSAAENKKEEKEPLPLVIPPDETESNMNVVYSNIDNIEEALSFDEQYPLEKLEDAEDRYKNYEKELDASVEIIKKNEMTMAVMEFEHAKERVTNIQKDLADRIEKYKSDMATWNDLQKLITDSIEMLCKGEKIKENLQDKDIPIEEIQTKLFSLSEAIKSAESVVCTLMGRVGLLLPQMVEKSGKSETLKTRVRDVEARFRSLISFMDESQQSYQEKLLMNENSLRSQLELMEKWCDEKTADFGSLPNSLDSFSLNKKVETIKTNLSELTEKKKSFVILESVKDQIIALPSTDKDTKHDLRRLSCNIAKRLADIRSDLTDRQADLEKDLRMAYSFWGELDELLKNSEKVHKRANEIKSAVIYTPSRENIEHCLLDNAKLRKDLMRLKDKLNSATKEVIALPEEEIKKAKISLESASNFLDSASALPQIDSLTEESMNSSLATVVDLNAESTDQTITRNTSVLSSQTEGFTEEAGEEFDENEPQIVGTLSSCRDSQTSSIVTAPRFSTKDEHYNQLLTTLWHWLTEMERDANATVDVSDLNQIKSTIDVVQTVSDNVRHKTMDVVGIQDSTGTPVLKQRARELISDMERIDKSCERRRQQLSRLYDSSRSWEIMRTELELWLDNSEMLIGPKKAEEASDVAMKEELRAIEDIISQLDLKREVVDNLNQKANKLLDEFQSDDRHKLSHQQSRINMRWTKFNDNIRIRRAFLDASLRSRVDFRSALEEFEEWLNRIVENVRKLEQGTANSQAIKNSSKRREWTQEQKILQAELDAHESVKSAVQDMGHKVLGGLEQAQEKKQLEERLTHVEEVWKAVKETEKIVGARLESAEQEWEKLTHSLSCLLSWIEERSKETLAQQPVAGNLSSVMLQSTWAKNLERDMENQAGNVRDVSANAQSYLMQHDLRPKMHKPNVLVDDEELLGISNSDAEKQRQGFQIHADCEQLREKWAELGKQLSDWQKVVFQAAQRLQELESCLAECQLHLSSVEAEIEKMPAVEQLRLEELKDARVESEGVMAKIDGLRIHIDDANDACGKILAADLQLDQHPRNQLDAVNQRFVAIRTNMRVRMAALRNALTDFGPSSEHFLNQSVAAPWQRAISKTNQLPYYIDHTTEKTQWEHPVWVEMAKELTQFNRVKFIAYRTAMKLRALQKRLCMDLVDIGMLEKVFPRLGGLSNEESPALEGMVCTLLPLFEEVHSKHPNQLRSVSLAVDLCINFLLNLFDPSRDGILRVLSFKIALIVFCNTPLEEKYRYIFDLVAQEGQADQKHIALLLYDLIHIPRLVGEAAAFGGSNVEPSVRSCFGTVRLASSINVSSFLEWLKQEPQSIVWLPVMHRLAAAEFAKHSAKCNVCKMFPIVGLRYRCLRCFNLDLCQNCFFSQRIAKKHKLKHPMQEYAMPTTSSEDARDFAKMVKNKFSRSKSTLGYLPVDMGDEGQPLCAAPHPAHNPSTYQIHQRTAALAQRLAVLTASQQAEPREEMAVVDLKSPAQLISQVEQMQKDELDQLLHRLQLENSELKRELERRRTSTTSTPQIDRCGYSSPIDSRRSENRAGTLPRLGAQARQGRSVPTLKTAQSQGDIMDEARALRLHKQRLEHRSRILEQQNEQLELQLQRLKKVIDHQQKDTRESVGRTTASVDREWIGRQSQTDIDPSRWEDPEIRSTRMQSLLATVDDLGKAMENLVVSVVYDSDSDD
ncbi:unnamed protein product [Auanema sp. JU1783]|nr:unnamed protein product [Auanema sp. JU1783]